MHANSPCLSSAEKHLKESVILILQKNNKMRRTPILPELGSQEELCQLHARELETCLVLQNWKHKICVEWGARTETARQQASPALTPRRALLLLLLWCYLGKQTPGTCVCIDEYIAMVHLPGRKAEMLAHREFPKGGKGAPWPLLMPRSGMCSSFR